MNLTEQHLKDLEAFLLEIPAKFANPILQFLGKIQQEQSTPAEAPVVELATEQN
jgi:hypothetical protein